MHRTCHRPCSPPAPLGAQCVEIGPVNATIHKVDEHVSLADLDALPGLYLALMRRLMA